MQQSMFGSVTSVRTCSKCGGTGKVVKDPAIPAMAAARCVKQRNTRSTYPRVLITGRPFVWRARGEIGENGGGYGDLLVTVYVQPNRVFVRKGYDIYCDVPITFVQAALGGEIND